MAALFLCCVGLIEWRSLPHVDRASALKTAAAAAFGGAPALARAFDMPPGRPAAPRTAAAIDSWGAIPVWPAWPTPTSPIGGRVRPITPDPKLADPFLLLAHHRHSFSPNDPLRGPFRTARWASHTWGRKGSSCTHTEAWTSLRSFSMVPTASGTGTLSGASAFTAAARANSCVRGAE